MTGTRDGNQTVARPKFIPTEANAARAKELQAFGFVHVTGLPTHSPHDDAQRAANFARAEALASVGHGKRPEGFIALGEVRYFIQAHQRSLGRHDYNNGMSVIVTPDGEVWLRAGGDYYGAMGENPYFKFCPNGGGAFVPCSNGEQVRMHHLLRRVANPYDDIHGEYPPEPHVKKDQG